jgi:cbb3-type cytochrome oxidase maturation protein
MTVLLYLVPLALLIGLVWLVLFLWSLHTGQYEDLDGAAFRVLDDSDIEKPKPTKGKWPDDKPLP